MLTNPSHIGNTTDEQSLGLLKNKLSALGISTSTPGLRGKARLEELQNRLNSQNASVKLEVTARSTSIKSNSIIINNEETSISNLKAQLTELGMSSVTPGLFGDDRKNELIKRLNASTSTSIKSNSTESLKIISTPSPKTVLTVNVQRPPTYPNILNNMSKTTADIPNESRPTSSASSSSGRLRKHFQESKDLDQQLDNHRKNDEKEKVECKVQIIVEENSRSSSANSCMKRSQSISLPSPTATTLSTTNQTIDTTMDGLDISNTKQATPKGRISFGPPLPPTAPPPIEGSLKASKMTEEANVKLSNSPINGNNGGSTCNNTTTKNNIVHGLPRMSTVENSNEKNNHPKGAAKFGEVTVIPPSEMNSEDYSDDDDDDNNNDYEEEIEEEDDDNNNLNNNIHNNENDNDDDEEDEAELRQQIKSLREHAKVLESIGDLKSCESTLERTLRLDPTDTRTLHYYAVFLHRRKGELSRAEAFFRRSLQYSMPGLLPSLQGVGSQSPNTTLDSSLLPEKIVLPERPPVMPEGTTDGGGGIGGIKINTKEITRLLLDYGSFLRRAKGDMDGALALYRRATQITPDDSRAISSFAHFLAESVTDSKHRLVVDDRGVLLDDDQENCPSGNNINKAAADEQDATTPSSTGTTGTTMGITQRLDTTTANVIKEAEELFLRALRLDPMDINAVGWYAKFLRRTGRLGKAELLYKAAVTKAENACKSNPGLKHYEPTALCNYACFLCKYRKKPEVALSMFNEALIRFPKHKGLLKNKKYLLRDYPYLKT